jgi:hypothetical protein
MVLAMLTSGLCSAAAPDAARDPRIGYWVEERVSPSYPQAQGLQIAVDDLGGGVIRRNIGANHTPEHQQVVDSRCDGAMHAVLNGIAKPVGTNYSCKVVGPREVESTTVPGNMPRAASTTLVETVSDDGMTLTGAWTSFDAGGKVIGRGSRHFTRRP